MPNPDAVTLHQRADIITSANEFSNKVCFSFVIEVISRWSVGVFKHF